MNKRFGILGLVLTMLLMATACESKTDSTVNNTDSVTETTAENAASETPTTENPNVTETPQKDGKVKYENTTDGYSMSYDPEVFEVTNENSTVKVQLPASETDENDQEEEKKDSDERNLFFSIITSTDTSVKEYEETFDAAYKKNSKKDKVKIGTPKTKAIQYKLTETKGSIHELYLVEGSKKVWVIELRCPKSEVKKYGDTLTEILDSLEFTA